MNAVRFVLALAVATTMTAGSLPRAVRHPGAVSPEIGVADPPIGYSLQASDPRIAVGPDQSLVIWNRGEMLARLNAPGDPLDVPAIAAAHGQDERFFEADAVWMGNRFVIAQILCTKCVVPPIDPFKYSLSIRDLDSHELARADVKRGEVAASTNGRTMLIFAAGDVYTFDSRGLKQTAHLTDDYAESPAVATDGDGFLAVWSDYQSVYARHIDANGAADGHTITIARGIDPAVARHGHGYAITYVRGRALALARVLDDGTTSFETIVRDSALGVSRSTLASNGTELRVVWNEAAPGITGGCYGFFGGDVGLMLDCSHADLMTATIGDASSRAAGVHLLRARAGYFGDRLSADLLGLAVRGNDFMLTWSELTNAKRAFGQGKDVFSMSLRDENAHLVSRAPADQQYPAIAQNGDGALVAWVEGKESLQLRAARVAANGARIGEPFTIATVRPYPSPALAWNGIDTVVAWTDDSRILAARVNAKGEVLDREPIIVADGKLFYSYPKIACGSDGCLVVWESDHAYGRRIDRSGAVLDFKAIDFGQRQTINVAWSGSEYVVITNDANVYSARVSNGSIVSETSLGAATSSNTNPHVACQNGECLLMTWRARTLFPFDLTPTEHSFRYITDLAWNGRQFVAIDAGTSCSLSAALFDAHGALVDRDIPIDARSDCSSALLGQGDGRSLIAYGRDKRVYLRTLNVTR